MHGTTDLSLLKSLVTPITNWFPGSRYCFSDNRKKQTPE